ncbi:MAG: type IV pilus secretin PilQ [Pseudomonadota bacterium]
MKQHLKNLLRTSLFFIAFNVALSAVSATTTTMVNTTADTGTPNPNIVTSAPNPALINTQAPAASITSSHGTLSFDFQDIDIRTLLQLIAKNSNLNFIISDTVKGSITLSLKNVTWERALDIILKARGLTARRVGNVIMISTIEEITTNESKQLQSDESLINLAPLVSKIIHLKYATATDVAAILKGPQSQLLTARGQVAIDTHTNSIIIRDTASNLQIVEREIFQLDIPAKQVLIEARIVNIDVNYQKQIGARFGISKPKWLSGNFFGANSLAQNTNAPFVATPGGTIDPTQRLSFNVPATALFGNSPGSIGIAVANVSGVLLDLELSALEAEQHGEVISTPRVMTSNQQKAVIQTGEEIPYQESTSSGATSVSFKNAVLSLEITPQITPDNKIVLTLKATQDTRGADTVLSSNGAGNSSSVPAINTQEVESNVIINNNETIVLGGVFIQTKSHNYTQIPFLGSIPYIGALFRNNADNDEKKELLIFITPKIVELHSGTTNIMRGEG